MFRMRLSSWPPTASSSRAILGAQTLQLESFACWKVSWLLS